ncbi:sugar transferase [Moheibacter sediminis]|uniref:Sugar transferase involved in LPS biosynthesis (Colanic, teichoic acid) n=1 Tax=Moheibacter sediminis TaxID=1434700 RepID=A0A1W2ALP4_9FLAO|nr:sugar transferase [Moheibacter sediminis]SMC61583.1 Sugar transferase involved in LPS biosynthesis (colanic, teichoic acid) [Moheibacter sediminis]
MRITKFLFDYLIAILIFPLVFPVIILLIIISTIDTGEFGLFTQKRVGKEGKLFSIYKIRSMKGTYESDITTLTSHKITTFGKIIRNYKLDELPQILNILLNQMSFVGPRPDVVGYADELKGEDRIILTLKPGITGPAQLAYRNEEILLSEQENPIQYNDETIWPDKVRINLEYISSWTFRGDLKYIWKTIKF